MPPSQAPVTSAEEGVKEVASEDEATLVKDVEEHEGSNAAIDREQEKTLIIENEELRITLSTIGGSVRDIELKNYFANEYERNIAFITADDDLHSFGVVFSKGKFNCNDFLFEVIKTTERAGVFRLRKGDIEIVRTYSLPESGFLLNVTVDVINHGQAQSINAEYDLFADANVAFDSAYEKRFVRFAVLDKDKIRSAHFDKVRTKGALYEGDIQWLGLRKKYFSIFVKPSFTMQHARASVIKGTVLRGFIKTPQRVLAPGESFSDTFNVFMGPSKLILLRSMNMGFDKVFSGGFWGLFRMGLLMLLGFFYNIFHNYGLAIIALTITIKILFIPLTHKSFSSMKKMQELQPKMKALQEQFKSDPQKLNKEVMELYKKHKVNPLGGCFPLLLQMPIFIALYQVLSEAVELRGAPFWLWIKDLSEADQFIQFPFTIPLVNISSLNVLPILMMGSMIWQQKLTGSSAQSKEQQQMMLMMPIIFVFIFYNLPSGLVLYWLLNNVLTIGHQLISHKMHPATQDVA